MKLKDFKSLGTRTDVMIHRYDGGILEEYDDCIVLKSPQRPNYWWGNMLLLPQAPQTGDYERWESLFTDKFPKTMKHRVYSWDINPDDAMKPVRGEDSAFLANGFNRQDDEVLAVQKEGLHTPKFITDNLEVRPLESSEDWAEVLELNVTCREARFKDANSYREFRRKQLEKYQRMQADDIGAIFGGFIDGKMVADMGLFIENGLGRFQHVETHPAYRKRGIAGSMVHQISEWGFTKRNAETLVLIADPQGPAVKLYKSLGYALQEIGYALEKPDHS